MSNQYFEERELYKEVDGYKFYIIPKTNKEGFHVYVVTPSEQYEKLKKGKTFIFKEFAENYIDKYIKQRTYKIFNEVPSKID